MRLARLIKIALAALVIGLTGGPPAVAQNEALQFVLDQARQRRILQEAQRRRALAQRARETRRMAPPTVVVGDTPNQPKVEPTGLVLVIGDTFADLLGGGLEQAFADQPEIAVVKRTRPETGLVRADFYDWP
jgi:hypothetical protein